MRVFATAVLYGLLLLPLLGADLRAQDRGGQIDDLRRQMEELQRQNQQQLEELRRKIEQLEAEKNADQMKFEEMKAEKAEGDKDAWWKNIEASYKKPGDGFRLKTKDDNFSLRTRLRTQFQFSVDDTDGDDTATNFDIRRFRLTFDGNAFRPWFEYTVQLDGESDDVALRDAFFEITYNTLFAPRLGQFKVPFEREELNSSSELQIVERSIVNEEFSFGRDRGVSIYGVLGNYITYGGGVFNGDGRNSDSADSNLLYAGRVQLGLGGDLEYGGTFPSGGDYKIVPNFGKRDKILITVGGAALAFPGLNIDRKTPDNDIDERFDEIGIIEADVYSFTGDVNVKYWIFSAEGEYIFRRISPEEGGFSSISDQGFRVQGGLFLVPEFIEVAGRYAYIDYDTDVDGRDSRFEVTPGLNFYLSRSHKWKLQLSYSFIRDEDTGGAEIDQNVFRAQLQAYF